MGGGRHATTTEERRSVRELRRRELEDEHAPTAARRGPATSIDLLLAMQRGHGNAHVSRMIARRTAQAQTPSPPIAEGMVGAADKAEASPGEFEPSLPRYRASSLDDEV